MFWCRCDAIFKFNTLNLKIVSPFTGFCLAKPLLIGM